MKRLAVGGMADIYLAQLDGPRGYETTVVVKAIREDLAEDEELIQLLMQEARIAACLKHENIVELIEVGEEGGTNFLVMDFIFGRNLAQIRDRCDELGVKVPYKHGLTILADALEALHYAHHEAMFEDQPLEAIHRDVSPANLMVAFDGSVKLLDFGLAKATAQISRTRAGVLKGKYAYMSPEQVNFSGVDHRADLFSTGVVLWELLVGRRLFHRLNEYETVKAVGACRVAFPKWIINDAPWGLSWVAYRALRKAPRWRYRNARQMRNALLAHDRRSRVQARDELAEWLGDLFQAQLQVRENALTKAHNNPIQRRMIGDAGFELLEEVTDPNLRVPLPPAWQPVPTGSQPPIEKGFSNLLGTALGSWRWFMVVLCCLVFFSVGLGVYIGRVQPTSKEVGYLHVLSEQPLEVEIGGRKLGRPPIQRIPVLPGLHRVLGRDKSGRLQVMEVEVLAGENKVIKFSSPTSHPNKTLQ